MTELARIRWWTVGWFVLLPGTAAGLVPWWMARRVGEAPAWHGSISQWLGAWLLLNGLGLAGWCVWLFNVEGRGTPVPWNPPQRFVGVGPYRFVRNPMLLGLFLALAGEAFLYASWAVVAYGTLVAGCLAAFVHLVEEPQLRRRFGDRYAAYCRQTPRWLPRIPRR